MSSTGGLDNTRPVSVVELDSQWPDGLLVAGADAVRLSWRVVTSDESPAQLAYEIQSATNASFTSVLATSGVVDGSAQIGIEVPGGRLVSREVRYFRVRVRTASGWSEWSPVLRIEAGLLKAEDWVGRAVTLPDDPGATEPAPSPILRRLFHVTASVVKARLYVTSLGLNRMSVNGTPVTADLFAPGWSAYEHRLLSDAYDVTSLVVAGSNVVSGVLADGWYRGRLGWAPPGGRCLYGTELGLLAQLEIELSDGSNMLLPTDESWRASTGEILEADIYDGCHIDLRKRQTGWESPGFDDSTWVAAATVDLEKRLIESRLAAPVAAIQTIPLEVPAGSRSMVLDGKQNISGFVRLMVRGKPGDRITVRHAEVVEPDGSLHTRSLRTARATDTYVLADDGTVELEPSFTFHGFQYAEIESTADVLSAQLVALSSARKQRSAFECADELLNRLHENVIWSQRDNFLSVPTDCPQRDERLGWTGDAQAFGMTACTLFDSQAFWTSWLRDLALEQDPVLGVPSVVPNVVVAGPLAFGRGGWADAATIVPWAIYESYGDPAILATQLGSMQGWVDSLAARRGRDGLLESSPQFGDWLDPDAPMSRPWEAKTDSDFIANAFFSWSSRLLGRSATVLGRTEMAGRYAFLAEEMASLTWSRWGDHMITTQTGCALALEFDLVPKAERDRVCATLARLVREAHGRVATGFLGTPIVLPALSRAGLIDEAYLMLLRRESPSWLYQVIMGGTTVWERWDAIRPDGSIHPGDMQSPADPPGAGLRGHMLSFNHYAYGAVIDWVYRNLAGLAPDPAEPGYRHVLFAPKPPIAIPWARASVESGYGRVAIDWRVDAGTLTCQVDLPFGTAGVFEPPTTEESQVTVDGVVSVGPIELGPGHHDVIVSEARLAGADGGEQFHEDMTLGNRLIAVDGGQERR